jgi:microcystin-dependent protein
MTNCSNCYNGCTEIVSDRCVKYTGIDVPVLGIQTGDSLSFVEQALITFLTSTLDGTGVKIDLGDTVVCTLVQQYLPTCKDLSIVDISKALIEAACDLQAQVDVIDADLAILNADYTVGCLTGVTASSDTHAIVQAVITKLCELEVDLIALALDIRNNYVPIVGTPGYPGIDDYIEAYLNGLNALVNAKMIPYVALPFFPTPSFLVGKFDGTGAGIGTWDKIYLCNGANGTPDLRGRTLVGATTGMGGGSFSPAVDPNIIGSGNPNYLLSTPAGANQITLGLTQIPSHTHIANAVSIVDEHGGHLHNYQTRVNNNRAQFSNSEREVTTWGASTSQTAKALTGITVDTTVTLETAGENLPHPNIQPSLGCYYIMYIP